MAKNSDFFISSVLGNSFIEELSKTEIYKAGTRTVVDTSDMHLGLKLVPRAIMSLLTRSLSSMQIGETKEIKLPVKESRPTMRVTKVERDCYNGEIEDSTEKYTDRKVAEFKYRSIPGIGLVVMSTFELYSLEDLEKEPAHEVPSPTLELVQKMIDDCLTMHDLIGKVKENKISERDAIQQLMLAKLSESIHSAQKPKTDSRPIENRDAKTIIAENVINVAPKDDAKVNVVVKNKKKILPLKEFLDHRKGKLKKNEYSITLTKGEEVTCPDCGQRIFKNDVFSGCVCYGDDMDKKVYLAKSDNGMKVRFGRGWDTENMEMLLEVLRRKRG